MKTARLISLIGVVCSILSCAKTEELEKGVERTIETRLFYAQTPSEETKTYIDSEYDIHWTADDRISVFCSATNEQYRFKGKTGEDVGSFENLTTPATPTYGRNYAVYPYQAGNASDSEGMMTVQMPSQQTYAENTFGLGANTMTAVTQNIADKTFKFNNVCGYLMIKLYGGDRIKSVTLRGNNNEKIAGEATITASYGNAPTIAMGSGATTQITLNCSNEGIPTQETSENYTQFWIVVPPMTFTNGFTIEITNTDDDVISRSTTKSVTINRNKILKMAPVKADAQNAKELLSFSLSDGVNTYDAFDISNGYVNVQVPNGTDMTNMTASFTYNGASIKVNDVPQTSGVGTHDFSDFVHPLTYIVSSKSGTSQSYIIRMFNLPIVFATTPGGVPITSKEIWTENCMLKIRGIDGILTDYGETNLKGKGNATWTTWPKKQYAIKFENKPNKKILGMPSHKRWCLRPLEGGRYFQDVILYELARRTESIEWSPRNKYVELFLNNEHLGIYLLVEHIKVDNNRVNITEMSSSDIEGDSITGGYLFTYDTTFDEPNKFHSQYFNMPVMFKDPDEKVLVQAQYDYLQNYINNFEASLVDSIRFTAREYLNYFDIDTYIDVYFVSEMAGPNGPLPSDCVVPRSVWFYKDRNDVIKAGPVWDFNGSDFTEKVICCRNAQYYGKLFAQPYFISRVKEKWTQFYYNVRDISNNSNSIADHLDSLYEAIYLSANRDWDMWWEHSSPIPGAIYRNPSELYNHIRNGIIPKLDFLESYINSLVVNYDTKPGTNEDVDGQDDRKDDFDFGF